MLTKHSFQTLEISLFVSLPFFSTKNDQWGSYAWKTLGKCGPW